MLSFSMSICVWCHGEGFRRGYCVANICLVQCACCVLLRCVSVFVLVFIPGCWPTAVLFSPVEFYVCYRFRCRLVIGVRESVHVGTFPSFVLVGLGLPISSNFEFILFASFDFCRPVHRVGRLVDVPSGALRARILVLLGFSWLDLKRNSK